MDDVDTWTNDATVDRLAYYFDGHIEFAGDKRLYYFTYECNVIYYDLQFAEIPAEDMQVMQSITGKLASKGYLDMDMVWREINETINTLKK